jgi:hypothetical protein
LDRRMIRFTVDVKDGTDGKENKLFHNLCNSRDVAFDQLVYRIYVNTFWNMELMCYPCPF